MLTREQIRAANVAKIVAVSVPEWGGEVFVKQLSPTQVMAIGEATRSATREQSLAIQLAAFLCDEKGVPVYSTEDAMAELVQSGVHQPVQRIIETALRENGMGPLEAVKGNS